MSIKKTVGIQAKCTSRNQLLSWGNLQSLPKPLYESIEKPPHVVFQLTFYKAN